MSPAVSVKVKITRGSASCAAARSVARLYGTHGIATHSFRQRLAGYTTFPGGWVCGALNHGNGREGGAECFRGGLGSLKEGLTQAATRNAHEVISLTF